MKYEKLSHYDHIWKRGEVYCGSFEPMTTETIIYRPVSKVVTAASDSGVDDTDSMSASSSNEDSSPLQMTKVTYVPALLKIFDEILMNASDQKFRDPEGTREIRVKIDKGTGEIEVFNDGKGLPVVMHDTEKCYIPELVFGHLLTGTNFDDTAVRINSGRNGIGAKLANIFSESFTVETANSEHDKMFRCTWTDHMKKRGKVHIGAIRGRGRKKDWTLVRFTPDYAHFKTPNGVLDDDHYGLMMRRVYDLATTLRGTVKVYLNDLQLAIKGIEDYVKLCVPQDLHDGILSDHCSSGRWHVAVVPAPEGSKHQQMTFANGVHTMRGGTHVNDVTNKVIDGLRKVVKESQLGDTALKNQFWLFLSCIVENPTFDTQTKEKLTLKASSWGSSWTPTPKFLKKLTTGPISDAIALALESKNDKMAKKTDGVKRSKISGIRKLVDATMAGTAQSAKCTLFLTEGDSAKSMAISGLSVLPEKDRRYFGVYPLRGKLLNVRDAPTKAVLDNKEITELKKILALSVGKVYKDTSELRYGRIALFTDADTDGSHIKGLIMNLLEHNWPSLLELPGFLCEFITPIVKATNGTGSKSKVMSFFSQQEFRQWNNGEVPAGWKVKYYKGLGTSTKDEAQGYFKALDRHMCSFHELSTEDREKLDLAFRKTRAADRKQWLAEYNSEEYLNRKVAQKNRISEFIDKDLIHFSNYDNVRNIPKMVDGLKPSQRKVIWTMLQKRITSDIKVAQLGAIVAEYTGYHHGEVSLFQTIINMAQDFVGSNNLNLLVPSGQFGSRLLGGSDASAPRYIYTRLQDFTRALFPVEDDMILNKQVDEGQVIEPEYLLPILPLVLINGATGIGTGYSTDVPMYKPSEILEAVSSRLNGMQVDSSSMLKPWYRGFTGTVTEDGDGKYSVTGLFETPNENTVVIKELPVGTWTENYIENTLDPLEEKGAIASVTKRFTDVTVDIQLKVPSGSNAAALIDKLKLTTTVRTSNMVLFDAKGHIKRYANIDAVIDDYMVVRLDGYCKRKAAQLDALRNEILVLDNRVRFIHACISGTVVLGKTKLEDVEKKLTDMKFARIKESYEYLHGMALSSLTAERASALESQLESKKAQYKDLEGRTPQQLWLTDLEKLSSYLTKLSL